MNILTFATGNPNSIFLYKTQIAGIPKLNNQSLMKTFFKIIKITLITIISIILSAFLYFYISNKLFVGSKKEENIKYLSSNKQVVNPGKKDIVFDDAFYSAKVILLGEIHGFADNQKLDKQLFLQLNKKQV